MSQAEQEAVRKVLENPVHGKRTRVSRLFRVFSIINIIFVVKWIKLISPENISWRQTHTLFTEEE